MVIIHLDAHILQTLAVGFCAGLAVEVGDNDAVYAQIPLQKLVPQTENVHIVRDAQITSNLVFLNVYGTDDNDNLYVVLKLKEHLHLTVRMEAGENTAGMIIVKQFAAEFHIQFIAEFGDTLLNVL